MKIFTHEEIMEFYRLRKTSDKWYNQSWTYSTDDYYVSSGGEDWSDIYIEYKQDKTEVVYGKNRNDEYIPIIVKVMELVKMQTKGTILKEYKYSTYKYLEWELNKVYHGEEL